MIDNEVCFQCPVEEECTDEIKAKYLKPDSCLWRRMGAVIDDDYERVQDAQRLYKSRETAAKPELETALDSNLTRGLIWTSNRDAPGSAGAASREAARPTQERP